MNPNDIESLSILKDAASLAVYGSRAANGIVMVKTKQGGKGKTAVNYTFNAEFSQPTKLLKKTRGYDYAYNQMLAGINDGLDEADLPLIRKYWISLKSVRSLYIRTRRYRLAGRRIENCCSSIQAYGIIEWKWQ